MIYDLSFSIDVVYWDSSLVNIQLALFGLMVMYWAVKSITSLVTGG